MKKIFLNTAAVAALVLTAGAASATCLTGNCGGSGGTLVSIGGGATTVGEGDGNFLGENGRAEIEKTGYSEVDIGLNGSGNVCTTADCTSLDGFIETGAGESLTANVVGSSRSPDTPTAALNELSSAGVLTAQLPGQAYELTVGTGGSGLGQANFLGEEGVSRTTADGYSDFDTSLDFDGLCPTCESGRWSLNARVGESVTAGATALTTNPNVPASAVSRTEAVGQIEFDFGSN